MVHEFGHRIQKLEDALGRSNYSEPGPDSDAVKIELQADCYARIWARYADKRSNVILEPFSNEQVVGALKIMKVTDDDTIQQHSGGGVQPDSWTHGSAEQCTKAFLAGCKSGKMSQCDTLGRGAYS